MASVTEAIKERRSIRNYRLDMVPTEMIERLLEAGNWAPSAGNAQPWRFYTCTGDYVNRICEMFYAWARDYIPQAPYIPEEKKGPMLEYARNLGGAPVHLVVSYAVDEDDEIMSEEALMAACAAIQNISLAAWEEGLGTVWIAGPVVHTASLRELLQLDPQEKVAGILALGYPAEQPVAPPRVDPELKEKVTWLGF